MLVALLQPLVLERVPEDTEARQGGPASWIHTKVTHDCSPTPVSNDTPSLGVTHVGMAVSLGVGARKAAAAYIEHLLAQASGCATAAPSSQSNKRAPLQLAALMSCQHRQQQPHRGCRV